jgi:hypothetical protein
MVAIATTIEVEIEEEAGCLVVLLIKQLWFVVQVKSVGVVGSVVVVVCLHRL